MRCLLAEGTPTAFPTGLGHSSLRDEDLRLLRDRVVNLLSVTPGFTFAMAHNVRDQLNSGWTER